MSRGEHRKPPMPPWFDSPRHGCCKWCNLPVYGRAQCWHKECKRLFEIATWINPGWNLARIGEGGSFNQNCASCGTRGWYTSMELDHITPLIADHSHIRCWMPANLQFLCRPCHLIKTQQDMKEIRRARKRTAQKGLALEATP